MMQHLLPDMTMVITVLDMEAETVCRLAESKTMSLLLLDAPPGTSAAYK
jgi:hypothetical protein